MAFHAWYKIKLLGFVCYCFPNPSNPSRRQLVRLSACDLVVNLRWVTRQAGAQSEKRRQEKGVHPNRPSTSPVRNASKFNEVAQNNRGVCSADHLPVFDRGIC